MTVQRSVKVRPFRRPEPGIVAVLTSNADLQRAPRLRHLPDLFELRLDALHPLSPEAERTIAKLTRPLIITARHPQEGGCNNLPPVQRRQLLTRFLPQAAYVDVELRSAAKLRSVLNTAKERQIKRIISVHDFRRTPPTRFLELLLHRAQELSADVFKIVTRTETEEEISRLIEFFESQKRQIPISAMGVGKLGRESRMALRKRGSVLNYVHLGRQRIKDQFSFSEMRRKAAPAR